VFQVGKWFVIGLFGLVGAAIAVFDRVKLFEG